MRLFKHYIFILPNIVIVAQINIHMHIIIINFIV
jgi:hypothetical protein